MEGREVVFIEGVRTAFGKMGGSLKDFPAEVLGGLCIKGLIEKTQILEKAHIDCIFAGCAHGVSFARNPARWSSLYGGIPCETSATFVEMQCGSAIDAINHAAWKILCNHADIVIAGGMECHSQEPAKFSTTVQPYRKNPPMYLEPQLAPAREDDIIMGLTAENLQAKYDISRESQDQFSFRSQALAKAAVDAGYFAEEIIPIEVPQGKKEPPFTFQKDEHLRLSSLEVLASLKPAFKENGTVTAGNSSGLNDGSAFVLMAEKEKALELGFVPIAKWICGGDCGVDPKIMGIAPAFAILQTLKRAGLSLSEIDVIECNEAFAVQNLAVIMELENLTGKRIDMGRWNPNGGAIAFGHPNGASGARLCMFAMRELIRRSGKYGLFSACCGGGLGVATVIENIKY